MSKGYRARVTQCSGTETTRGQGPLAAPHTHPALPRRTARPCRWHFNVTFRPASAPARYCTPPRLKGRPSAALSTPTCCGGTTQRSSAHLGNAGREQRLHPPPHVLRGPAVLQQLQGEVQGGVLALRTNAGSGGDRRGGSRRRRDAVVEIQRHQVSSPACPHLGLRSPHPTPSPVCSGSPAPSTPHRPSRCSFAHNGACGRPAAIVTYTAPSLLGFKRHRLVGPRSGARMCVLQTTA